MVAITARIAIDWHCRDTWRRASGNTAWCLLGCAIGDFGTIAFFQLTGTPWPTMAIMILAIVNGLLTSIALETFGTGKLPDADLVRLIDEHFDLRPAAIIDRFDLRRPIYGQTAAYGHFGRPLLDLPWEQLDMVDTLRRSAGLDA